MKGKRHVIRSLIDRVKARFNVSIAEVADNDAWERATIGLSAVGNDRPFVNECLDRVIRFMEQAGDAVMASREVELISVGEDLYGADDGSTLGTRARGLERTLAEAEAEAELVSASGPSSPRPKKG